MRSIGAYRAAVYQLCSSARAAIVLKNINNRCLMLFSLRVAAFGCPAAGTSMFEFSQLGVLTSYDML
jgi:hypothetical protein